MQCFPELQHLLQGSPGWWGKRDKFILCISSVALWLSLCLPVLAHTQGEESVPCAMLSPTQNVTLRCTAPCLWVCHELQLVCSATSLKMSEDSGYEGVMHNPFLFQHRTSTSAAMESTCSLWLIMAITKWREILNKFFYAFWLLSHHNQVKHHRKMPI